MADGCRKCGADVPLSFRECPVCSTEAGFPNVRIAEQPAETNALEARYSEAMTSARARGISTELHAFEEAVGNSRAIMNRSLGALSDWLNGASELFISFHKQVEHLGRTPADTEWDQQRQAAEAAINPYCYQELIFAALTLDGRGMTYYGPYSVTLRSITIEERATVFEQNPFLFNRIHHVIAGQSPPLGYRATWPSRGRLAVAKLQSKIVAGAAGVAFAEILMEPRRNESDCDFVEAHIFGPVNRKGIERIVGPAPSNRPDRTVWKQVVRKAKELGVTVEEIA